MKFRTYVEPPEPMRGLEVPPEVVESLGQAKRPRVTITINGHITTDGPFVTLKVATKPVKCDDIRRKGAAPLQHEEELRAER